MSDTEKQNTASLGLGNASISDVIYRGYQNHSPDHTQCIGGQRTRLVNTSHLDMLGDKHGTDKCSWGHNYLIWYEQFLESRQHEIKSVCELGVARGLSLRMWRDYFPNARILGLDLHDKSWLVEDRIETVCGDQTDPLVMQQLVDRGAPFDLVVDDAGHMPLAQIYSFEHLSPHMNHRGVYIIEDLSLDTTDPNDITLKWLAELVKSQFHYCGTGTRIESISLFHEPAVLIQFK